MAAAERQYYRFIDVLENIPGGYGKNILKAKGALKKQYIHNLLKGLFKWTIWQTPEAEMRERLGYGKHSPLEDLTGNRRNGFNETTLQTQRGKTEIKLPRNRNGEFDPQLSIRQLNIAHSNRK